MNITVQSAKMVGGRLANLGLIGVGAGVGIVFGSSVMTYAPNPSLKQRVSKLYYNLNLTFKYIFEAPYPVYELYCA